MEKYNLDKLVKVVVNDIYPARWFSFKKEKRFLGYITRKEGYYEWVYDSFVGNEVPKDHLVKDGILYEKPEVILWFQDNNSKKFIFDTHEEAKNFASILTNDRKWLS